MSHETFSTPPKSPARHPCRPRGLEVPVPTDCEVNFCVTLSSQLQVPRLRARLPLFGRKPDTSAGAETPPLPRGTGSEVTSSEAAFSPDVLAVFLAALKCATKCRSSLIEEEHLLYALSPNRASPMVVSSDHFQSEPPTLDLMLDRHVLSVLGKMGVDTKALLFRARDFPFPNIEPDFWKSEKGRRLHLVCSNPATEPGAAVIATLLVLMEAEAPEAEMLRQVGLREEALYTHLQQYAGVSDAARRRVDELLREIDVSAVLSMQLSRAAQFAIPQASRPGEGEVDDSQLLTGILFADVMVDPGAGARRVLDELRAYPEIWGAQQTAVRLWHSGRPAPPVLSSRVARAIEMAGKSRTRLRYY